MSIACRPRVPALLLQGRGHASPLARLGSTAFVSHSSNLTLSLPFSSPSRLVGRPNRLRLPDISRLCLLTESKGTDGEKAIRRCERHGTAVLNFGLSQTKELEWKSIGNVTENFGHQPTTLCKLLIRLLGPSKCGV